MDAGPLVVQESGSRIYWIRSTEAATCHPAIDPFSPHDLSLDEADILESGLDPGLFGLQVGGEVTGRLVKIEPAALT